MTDSTEVRAGTRRNASIITAVACLYGAFVFAALPTLVLVVNDDFGYLQSIVGTMHRGRPWTDDWLEPWAASLSVLSALIVKISGSFRAATSGAQGAFAALALAGAAGLFHARGLSAARSLLIALVVVTFPTVFLKQVEFTGTALYIPCLLWAMWAAERRRWLVFLAIWTIAVATRQSALAWLALPAWSALVSWRTAPARREWLVPAAAVVGAGAIFAVLSLTMNHTHAHRMITDRLSSTFDPTIAAMIVATGLTIAVGFFGLGAAVVSARNSAVARSPYWHLRAIVAIASAALVFVAFPARMVLPEQHSNGFAHNFETYFAFLLIVAAAGWTLPALSVRWSHVLAASAALGLLAIRGRSWDYYFLDVAAFAFFAPMAAAVVRSTALPRRSVGVAAVTAAVGLLVGHHARAAFDTKRSLDHAAALISLAEPSLRDGRLEPEDVGFAPFGFAGWTLYPYFVANDGRDDPGIGNFVGYERPGAVDVRTAPPFRGEEPLVSRTLVHPDDPALIATGLFRVGWFWHQRVAILHGSGDRQPALLTIDRSRYSPTPFPLNDTEWLALIDKK